MSDLGLYLCTVLIWGSTWLAIKFQLGVVPPTVSVAWRFGTAAAILLGYALYRRQPLRFNVRTHAWLALQGLSLFGINYVLVYLSEQTLTSGLVAVTFSLIIVFNIVFLRLFFRVPIRVAALAGAALGITGVAVLFWPDLSHLSMSPQRRDGLLYCVLSTAVASLGNMAATRNHRQRLPLVSSNAWAMMYGAVFVGVYALLAGQALAFETTFRYVASLLYLALFGSVIAFLAYLTLLGRIGADRAGYSGVASPVVAMLLSTFFEKLQWDGWIIGGMALCIAGNVLTLRRGQGSEPRRP